MFLGCLHKVDYKGNLIDLEEMTPRKLAGDNVKQQPPALNQLGFLLFFPFPPLHYIPFFSPPFPHSSPSHLPSSSIFPSCTSSLLSLPSFIFNSSCSFSSSPPFYSFPGLFYTLLIQFRLLHPISILLLFLLLLFLLLQYCPGLTNEEENPHQCHQHFTLWL